MSTRETPPTDASEVTASDPNAKGGKPPGIQPQQAVVLRGLADLLEAGGLLARDFVDWCDRYKVTPCKLENGAPRPLSPEDQDRAVMGLAEPHSSKDSAIYPGNNVVVLLSTADWKSGSGSPYTEYTTTTSTETVVKKVMYLKSTAPAGGTLPNFAGWLVRDFLFWCTGASVTGKKRVNGKVVKIDKADHSSRIEKNDSTTPAGDDYSAGQDVIVILETESRKA